MADIPVKKSPTKRKIWRWVVLAAIVIVILFFMFYYPSPRTFGLS